MERRHLLGAGLVAILLAASGTALAARIHADPAGDARLGPDVVALSLAHTRTTVTFRFTFAKAPPLGARAGGWIDMLLVGIDVPPLGPAPVSPGGEWRGVDYFFGTHGASRTGVLVKAAATPGATSGRQVMRLAIVTRGRTVSVTVPRARLGDPAWIALSAAAAREWNDESAPQAAESRPDVVPDRGTLRYRLAG